jgi:hypothetical protein
VVYLAPSFRVWKSKERWSHPLSLWRGFLWLHHNMAESRKGISCAQKEPKQSVFVRTNSLLEIMINSFQGHKPPWLTHLPLGPTSKRFHHLPTLTHWRPSFQLMNLYGTHSNHNSNYLSIAHHMLYSMCTRGVEVKKDHFCIHWCFLSQNWRDFEHNLGGIRWRGEWLGLVTCKR